MRRILLVLATMLAAVLMASGLALAAKPFSNATTITINDGTFSPEVGDIPGKATPYPSVIDVSGLSGTIEDVNLKLRGYRHPFPDDVDVLLVGPSGANAIGQEPPAQLFRAQNGQVPTGQLRKSRELKLPFPRAPPSGESVLSVFDGTDPNGTWQLYVVDDAEGDTGQIARGWALTIQTTS